MKTLSQNSYLFLFLALGLVVSCQSKKDESKAKAAAPPPVATPASKSFAVESVSLDGCLNLPAYFAKIEQLDRTLPVFEATTQFKMTSKSAIRPNFEKTLAYGAFVFENKTFPQIPEIRPIEQQSCQSLTFRLPDGSDDAYKIKESSGTAVRAEKESGESYQIRYLSPTSLEIKVVYKVFDSPCNKDAAADVELTKVLDWSQRIPDQIDAQSPLAIETGYLNLVAETTGSNPAELFSSADPQAAKVIVAKLTEISHKPPLPEILACRPLDSQTPLPTPTPDPSSDDDHDNAGEAPPGAGPQPSPTPGAEDGAGSPP